MNIYCVHLLINFVWLLLWEAKLSCLNSWNCRIWRNAEFGSCLKSFPDSLEKYFTNSSDIHLLFSFQSNFMTFTASEQYLNLWLLLPKYIWVVRVGFPQYEGKSMVNISWTNSIEFSLVIWAINLNSALLRMEHLSPGHCEVFHFPHDPSYQ